MAAEEDTFHASRLCLALRGGSFPSFPRFVRTTQQFHEAVRAQVGGVVINDKTQEILVVKERNGPITKIWKVLLQLAALPSASLLNSLTRSHPCLSNCAQFPGGMLELGEEIKDGVVREVKEETGIDAVQYINNNADGFILNLLIPSPHPEVCVAYVLPREHAELSWEVTSSAASRGPCTHMNWY